MVEFRILKAGRRVKSKLTTLDFRRADFGLFKDLLGRVPGDKVLDGNEAQESWSLFKDHLLQAQELENNDRRPAQMNKLLLVKLKTKIKHRGWKRVWVTWEEYRNNV